MSDKKTKIIATLGPSSDNNIEGLIKAGVDIFRCNFSHGSHEDHSKRIAEVKKISKNIGRDIAILADLCGPKIRIGDFESPTIILKKGKTFTFTSKKCIGNENIASVSYERLPREISVGDTVLLDDGKCKLFVTSVSRDSFECRVDIGGEIRGRRGLSVPSARLSLSSLTLKDKKDLIFALGKGVDFVALSFVRDSKDINKLRKLVRKYGSDALIIAKMETQQAVEKADDIIESADGIMVARGDLAVETSVESVPLLQKNLITKANRLGRPVITATQMLESMIDSPVPTRAEVSDIANAILDGTDAIMLSGETAVGKFPCGAVRVMDRVAGHVEKDYLHRKLVLRRRGIQESLNVTDSITSAAVSSADAVKARFIIALTMRGRTARMLSRHKPSQEIVALVPSDRISRQLCISFGIKSHVIRTLKHIDDVVEVVRDYFLKNTKAQKGEKIVIVCGVPLGKSIDTNMVLVEEL